MHKKIRIIWVVILLLSFHFRAVASAEDEGFSAGQYLDLPDKYIFLAKGNSDPSEGADITLKNADKTSLYPNTGPLIFNQGSTNETGQEKNHQSNQSASIGIASFSPLEKDELKEIEFKNQKEDDLIFGLRFNFSHFSLKNLGKSISRNYKKLLQRLR